MNGAGSTGDSARQHPLILPRLRAFCVGQRSAVRCLTILRGLTLEPVGRTETRLPTRPVRTQLETMNHTEGRDRPADDSPPRPTAGASERRG